MSTTELQRRYDDANDKGRQARRAGRKRMDNPFRGHTKLVRDLHEQWDLGWLKVDAELRRAA
jgi:hypothetical protein